MNRLVGKTALITATGQGFIDSVYVPDIRSHTQGGATVGLVNAFLGSGCDRLVAAAFAKEFH